MAEAELLLETFKRLHKLWQDALPTRANQGIAGKPEEGQGKAEAQKDETDYGREQEEELLEPDSYGEQVDIVAQAILKALHKSRSEGA